MIVSGCTSVHPYNLEVVLQLLVFLFNVKRRMREFCKNRLRQLPEKKFVCIEWGKLGRKRASRIA
jgi:hypothetical protein